jgi:hypothetical protein
MNSFLLIQLIAILTLNTNSNRILARVKIYSNLAEIIQPLGKLPLEFSAEDWEDIRPDSVTLVGTNVTVTQQTITEKKTSLNNAQIYVRSPTSSSSNAQIKFVKATLIDEKRNLVKLVDKNISKESVFLTVPADHIVYTEAPPQSKYYVNFTYNTIYKVYVSYIRSNLNWKRSYQLNLFEDSKKPVLISMADIRNHGQAKIDIEQAELLGGYTNLQVLQPSRCPMMCEAISYSNKTGQKRLLATAPRSSIVQGDIVAGFYVFGPFSIDAKTNYLVPMFHPQVTIERYASISKYFYGHVGNSKGTAQRSYRLSSDQFLSRGNCIIRETERLVGETLLPDLAAENKHDFSIGEDPDIIYKEDVILFSTRTYNEIINHDIKDIQVRTASVYKMRILLKNSKRSRTVKVEYKQQIQGRWVQLVTPDRIFTQHGTTINGVLTLSPSSEKLVSYTVKIIT